MAEWRNWAGCVVCEPREQVAAASEDQVAQCVRDAAREGLGVRVVGSGHSFTPLVATDGLLLSLDGLAGIESVDPAARSAWIRAGSKLSSLGPALREHGLAFANLGDVDVQSLGGALGTGTHGTGRTLQNLSASVTALRLVDASGEVRCLDEARDAEALRAARVSFGALGVMTAARLRLVPAYRLHERVSRLAVEECLDGLAARIAAHRHCEFFWYPGRDRVELKCLDPTDAGPESVAGRDHERIDWSDRVLPSLRELRFVEMEYSIPAEQGPDCFRALRQRIRSRHPDLLWPVEYRTLRSDDAWLSSAHGRETVTLSVHQGIDLPHLGVFRDLEPILLEAGGRPHWGKWHSLGAFELAARLPRFADFQRQRRELDPAGRFANPHLRRILGDV